MRAWALCAGVVAALIGLAGCGDVAPMNIAAGDSERLAEVIEQSDKPVLVDFWKFGCASCAMVDPIVHELANEYHNRVVVARFMAMHFWLAPTSSKVWSRHQLWFMPTVILFIDGQEVKRWTWNVDTNAYRRELDKHVGIPATQPDTEPGGDAFVVEAERFRLVKTRIEKNLLASADKVAMLEGPKSRIVGEITLPAGAYEVVVIGLAEPVGSDTCELTIESADSPEGEAKVELKLSGGSRRPVPAEGRGQFVLGEPGSVKLTISATGEGKTALDRVKLVPVASTSGPD
jgi:thioredoxin 1